MIRTVFLEGKFVPIDPIPPHYREGGEYRIADADNEQQLTSKELDRLFADINVLAKQLHDDDDQLLENAIRTVRQADREKMRPTTRIE